MWSVRTSLLSNPSGSKTLISTSIPREGVELVPDRSKPNEARPKQQTGKESNKRSSLLCEGTSSSAGSFVFFLLQIAHVPEKGSTTVAHNVGGCLHGLDAWSQKASMIRAWANTNIYYDLHKTKTLCHMRAYQPICETSNNRPRRRSKRPPRCSTERGLHQQPYLTPEVSVFLYDYK